MCSPGRIHRYGRTARKSRTSARGAALPHDCTDFPFFRQDGTEKSWSRSVGTKQRHRAFRRSECLGAHRPGKEFPEDTVPRLQQHPRMVSSDIRNCPVGDMKKCPAPAANEYEPDATATSFAKSDRPPARHICVPAPSGVFSAIENALPGESTPYRGGGDYRGWPSPPRHRRKPFPILRGALALHQHAPALIAP